MRISVKIRTEAYFSPSSKKLFFLLLFLIILSKKMLLLCVRNSRVYIKSNCSTESKVCFVHTHTKYPELSLSNYISIAISKSYKTTDKKNPLSFICTPLWGQEVEKNIR